MDLFQDQNESRDCIKESQYLALGVYLEFYVYLAVSVSYNIELTYLQKRV